MKRKVKAAGKYLVTKASTHEEVEMLRKEGAVIIGISSDQQMLMQELTEKLAVIRK